MKSKTKNKISRLQNHQKLPYSRMLIPLDFRTPLHFKSSGIKKLKYTGLSRTMIFNLYAKKGCVYCKEMHILFSYKICFDFNHTWYSHTRSEKFDYSIRTFLLSCYTLFSVSLILLLHFFEARFSAYWKKISSGTEYLIDLFCFSFLLLHSDDLNCIYIYFIIVILTSLPCCFTYFIYFIFLVEGEWLRKRLVKCLH